jgi:hypothetical protein
MAAVSPAYITTPTLLYPNPASSRLCEHEDVATGGTVIREINDMSFWPSHTPGDMQLEHVEWRGGDLTCIDLENCAWVLLCNEVD